MKTKTIKLSDIVIDAETQQRVSQTDSVIDEYCESIKCGAKFPPVVTFFNGVEYFLVDGFHRYFAYKKAGGIDFLDADIHEGTKRDAILYSASVNGTHGLRLTNKDKRKHVLVLLNDSEWSQWTDTLIAKHCKVTQQFVSKVRREINDIQKDIISKSIKTVLGGENNKNEQSKSGINSTSLNNSFISNDSQKKLSTGEPLENQLDNKNSAIDNDAHNEFNQFSEEQIAEEMASEIDVEKELYNAHMEIERLTKIIESDDKLSEIKRLSDLVQHWEEKSNGYQVAFFNKNEDLKKWKCRAEKLERELKNAGMVEF